MTAIDHAAEARALLSASRTAHDADRLIAEAHVHAMLALTAEQREANRLASMSAGLRLVTS